TIAVVAKETVEPSPLAAETVSARVYAFLDGAPLEERRVRAVAKQRWLKAESAELTRLDSNAIEQVQREVWPDPKDAEELHDALLGCAYLTQTEALPFKTWLTLLSSQGRACCLEGLAAPLWIAAEE
ncbi:MAG: hypothetical protein ACK4JF_07890, partial [Methylohalobius sp.]